MKRKDRTQNDLERCKVSFEEWKSRVEKSEGFKLIEMYYKVRKDTQRNETWFKIKHERCGVVFERPSNMYTKKKGSSYCPNCGNELLVSNLHAYVSSYILSSVSGSKIEYDIGFVGDKGKPSAYDLFIPTSQDTNRGIVVEFQSRYHDDREEFDLRKKDFAISNGYIYYSFDHRDCMFDDVIKILTGDENIDLSTIDVHCFKTSNIDIVKAQSLLNQYMPIKQVGRELGRSGTMIYSLLNNGVLKLPKNYINISGGHTPMIQLTMDGEFVSEHKNGHSCVINGKKSGFCEKDKRDNVWYRNGYAWVKNEDYYNNDYNIEDIAINHCKTFYMVDDDFNVLKTFASLKDAKEYINTSSVSYISDVLKHKKRSNKRF